MQTESEIREKKNNLVHRRREQILAAARGIFARNGFRRTKIDDIADHLGVGKGTVYRYFKDKKSLFLAVYEQGMNELRHRFDTGVLPITDPRHKLAAAVKTYFAFFEENRELIEIQAQVRSEFRDDYRRMFMDLYHDYIEKIEENLRNGIRAGLFRDMDVEKTANAISASLQGVLASFYIREFVAETDAAAMPKSLSGRIEAVTALLLEGLLKRDGKTD